MKQTLAAPLYAGLGLRVVETGRVEIDVARTQGELTEDGFSMSPFTSSPFLPPLDPAWWRSIHQLLIISSMEADSAAIAVRDRFMSMRRGDQQGSPAALFSEQHRLRMARMRSKSLRPALAAFSNDRSSQVARFRAIVGTA